MKGKKRVKPTNGLETSVYKIFKYREKNRSHYSFSYLDERVKRITELEVMLVLGMTVESLEGEKIYSRKRRGKIICNWIESPKYRFARINCGLL